MTDPMKSNPSDPEQPNAQQRNESEPVPNSVPLNPSIGSQETIAPSGLDSTPTGSGPFASLPVMFGRFEVRKLLGRGAMGTVYLAFDPELQKSHPEGTGEVALKIPKFQADDDPVLLERFWREAQATGAMNHDNICKLHEIGEINGTHYISMEYIDGRQLADYVGPDQRQRQVVAIIRKLAQGLAHAHKQGFIHRDLKPSNIMVAIDGQPKLMDFGLARRFGITGDIKLTQSNTIVGSPAYMSPEQARSENDTLTPASDIYSLGTLFFELLTGELPFKGPMAIVLGMIALQRVPKPSSIRADVDPALESLCLKMLEKKVAARPQSMGEIANTLTEWLQRNKPPTADSPLAPALRGEGPGVRGSSSSPELSTDRQSPSPEPAGLVPKKPATSPVPDKADFITEQQRRVTEFLDKRQYGPAIELLEKMVNLRDAKFEKLVAWAKPKLKETRATEQQLKEASTPICALAEQDLKRHDYTSAVQILEQVPPAYRSAELRELLSRTTDLRDECDHLFQDIDEAIRQGDAETLPALVKRLLKLKPNSKSVKQLAEEIKKLGVKKTIARRRGQRLIESNDRLFEPKQIAAVVLGIAALFASVYFAVVMYVQTSHGTLVVDVQGEGLQAIVQDGHLVIRDGKQQFRIKTTEKKTLSVEHKGTTVTGSSREITLKRGEKRTVTIKLIDGKIELTDNSEKFAFPVIQDTDVPPTGQKRFSDEAEGEVHRLHGHTNGALMVAFSPDGKWIASGGDGVIVWDVQTGAKVSELPDRGTRAISFSRNGTQLVLGGMGRILRVVDVESRKELSRFDRHQQIVHSTACSPVTDLVASGDGGFWDDKTQQWASAAGPKLRLWNSLTGQQVAELAGHAGPIHAVAFSRDGQMIATASIDQTVRLWSVREQRQITKFDGHQAPVMSVGFSTADTLALEGVSSTSEATIVSGDAAGEVRLWSIREGRLIRAFQASNQSVHQLSVTRGGQFLTACATDQRVNLWKPFGQESTYQFSGNDEAVYSVASSPDGRLAATAGGLYGTGRDFSVRIHRLPLMSVSKKETNWVSTDAANPGIEFVKTETGWEERKNGAATYRFAEVSRNDTFTELFDASRGMSIRLHKDHCEVCGDRKSWALLYTGRWRDVASKTGWTPCVIKSTVSQVGARLTSQPDQSILVSGPTPDTDAYVLDVGPVAGPITAIKLEALTHDSLPFDGPGRATDPATGHGRFILTQFEARVVGSDGKELRKLKFDKATESFAQHGYEARNAISPGTKTGWAIDSPQTSGNSNQHAIFEFDNPFGLLDNEHLQITLRFGNTTWKESVLGHFRLSTSGNSGSSSTVAVGNTPAAQAGDSKPINTALQFNGTGDLVRVPHNPRLDLTNAATISAWVRFDTKPSAMNRIMTISAKSGNRTDFDLQVERNDRFKFYAGDGYNVESKTKAEISKWCHVAATFQSGGRMALFINGVEEGNVPFPIVRNGNSGPLTFGESAVFTKRLFNGQIADVRLWNVARTADQIRADMAHRLTGREPGLVGYWPLDETSGTVANDKTTGGNHGVLTGSTTNRWLRLSPNAIPSGVQANQSPPRQSLNAAPTTQVSDQDLARIADPQRRFAVWVTQSGGAVAITPNQWVTRSDALPLKPFTVDGADIVDRQTVPETIVQIMPRLNLKWLCSKKNAADVTVSIFNRQKCQSLKFEGYTTSGQLDQLAASNALVSIEFYAANGYSEMGLKNLKKFPNLTKAVFNAGWIDDAGLAHLSELKHINELMLWATGVTDEGLIHLRGMASLEKLRLESSQMIRGPGIQHLVQLPKLKTLSLYGTAFSDVGMEFVGKLSTVEELGLGLTKVTDAQLHHVNEMKALKRLYLWGTAVTDSVIPKLKVLSRLTSLELENTAISDLSINELKVRKNLKKLVIRKTKITENGVRELRRTLPKCEIVY